MAITITAGTAVASDEEIAPALQEQVRKEDEAAVSPASKGADSDGAEGAGRTERERRDGALAARTRLARREAERTLMRKWCMNTSVACFLLALSAVILLYQFVPFWPLTVLLEGGEGQGQGEGNTFDPAEWFQGGEWEAGYDDYDSTAWAPPRGSSSGLRLLVLNNLDEGWQDTFAAVMSEWENGEPDAVSFRIERISDSSCPMVPDAMVVCNGDYGRTDWRGINELVLKGGLVVASVAKLNDFFLGGADGALRQYICCHEIGHGLGLGHTDEALRNPDRGECMDYTMRPEANRHPGRANFEALEGMYGRVRRGWRDEEADRSGRRTSEDVASYSTNGLEWRALRRTARAEHYEADLGGGRKVRRVLLLA